MSEKAKKSGKNFMVQGSILAIAGVITKIIGAVYRVPLAVSYTHLTLPTILLV